MGIDTTPQGIDTIAAAPAGAGTITFAPALSGRTITLASEIVIGDADGVTVDATAVAAGVTLNDNAHRIFSISAGANVTLLGLTLTGGNGAVASDAGSAASFTRCTFSGPDIYKQSGTINSTGVNLIGKNDTVATEFPAGPFVGTIAAPLNALLAPLGNYGGPTQTIPSLAGSPAIDAATEAHSPPHPVRNVPETGGGLNS